MPWPGQLISLCARLVERWIWVSGTASHPAIQPAKNNYAAAANFSLFVGIKWKFWKSLECSCGAIGWLASEIKIQPHALRSLFYGSPAAGLFIRNFDTGKTSSFNQEYGLGS